MVAGIVGGDDNEKGNNVELACDSVGRVAMPDAGG